MNRFLWLFVFMVLFWSCSTIGDRTNESSRAKTSYTGLNLNDALENAVLDINAKAFPNSILALVNFSSTSESFSQYLMDELMNKIINRTKLKIVERKQIELVQDELNFQMSGSVSEETAKSIGKFIGADSIITGNFMAVGNNYRIGIKTIHVETGIVQSLFITNIEKNADIISIYYNSWGII